MTITIRSAASAERVSTYLDDAQRYQQATVLADGGYVIVWQSSSQDGGFAEGGIYSQRYNAAGARVGGETLVNSTTAGSQTAPQIAALADGGYIVTWSTSGSPYDQLYTQRYDSAGVRVGVETHVPTSADVTPGGLTAVSLAGGGYVLAWVESSYPLSSNIVRVQRYDANGAEIGATFEISTVGSAFNAPQLQLLAHSAGGFGLAWSDGAGLHTQDFDAAGTASTPHNLGSASGVWDVAALTGGGFVAVWVDSSSQILIQHLDAAGAPVGEIQVSNQSYGFSSVAGLADGGFVILRHPLELYAQVFNSAGEPVGQELLVNENSQLFDPVALGLSGGGFVAVWNENGNSTNADVHQRYYLPPVVGAVLTADVETADGDGADDTFLAVPSALNAGDRIAGGAGQDTLQITATGTTDLTGVVMTGVERILGTSGDDVIVFGDRTTGLTTLESGGGHDILRLADGFDLADLPTLVGDWTIAPVAGAHGFVLSGGYQGAPLNVAGLNFGIDASTYALTQAERESLFANGVGAIEQPGGYTFVAAMEATSPGPAVQVAATPGAARVQIDRLGDGYIVVWSAYSGVFPGSAIFAQRYDASGNKLGAEIRFDAFDNVETSVTGLDDGFVIVWSSTSGASGGKVYSQQFDLNGAKVGAEQLVATESWGAVMEPSSAAVTGGYVLSWNQQTSATGYDVYGQRYDASGAKIGGAFLLNTPSAGNQTGGVLTSLSDGGFATVWTSDDLRLQRFDAAGSRVGADIFVTSEPTYNSRAAVVALTNGGLVVSWITPGDDGLLVVRSQRFDASGAKVGAETEAGGYPTDAFPAYLSAEALPGGGYILVWTVSGVHDVRNPNFYTQLHTDIYSQRYDANGQAVGQETRLNYEIPGDQFTGVATVLDSGQVVTVWTRYTGSNQGVIEMNGVNAVTFVSLTAGADTLTAPTAPRLVLTDASHFDASDTLAGGAGVDRIDMVSAGTLDLTAPAAFSGFEIVVGSGGDDLFIASTSRLAGVTDIYGSAGDDVVRSAGAGTLNLSTVKLHDVETIEGSAGDDTVIVNLSTLAADQHLAGGDGQDTLISAAGGTFDLRGWAWTGFEILRGSTSNDTFILSEFRPGGTVQINGAEGTDDTVDYSRAAAGVTMTGAHVSIEVILGSAFDDIIRTGDGGGRFSAGAGDDVVYGGLGADAITVGRGDNTVYGGAGDDSISIGETGLASDHNVLLGEAGNDYISGGWSADDLYGGDGADIMGGGGGDDLLVGGAGADRLSGDGGSNALYGQAGNDTLYGTDLAERDFLFGGAGNDTYYVASTLTGPLDLVFEGGDNPDVMGGVNDVDTIITQGAFFWDYYDVAEILRISGVSNAQLVGGTTGQTFFGNNATDLISVYGGSNRVDAGKGTDAISFGLYGLDESHDGVNTLVMKAGNGLDYVYEFESGVDKIDLTAFNFGITGQQVLDQAVNVDNPGTADDYCYFYLTSAGGVDNYVAFIGLLSSQLQAADFITGTA